MGIDGNEGQENVARPGIPPAQWEPTDVPSSHQTDGKQDSDTRVILHFALNVLNSFFGSNICADALIRDEWFKALIERTLVLIWTDLTVI